MANGTQSPDLFGKVSNHANQASKSLDNLSASLLNLGKVSNSLKGLDGLSTSITRIASALESLQSLPQLAKNIKNVDFGGFENQMKSLATALEPLRGFRTQAGSVIVALTSLDEAVETVDDTSLDDFKGNIKELRKALIQLNAVKPTIGSTMQALGQLTEIVSDLDALSVPSGDGTSGFDSFKDNIGKLAEAFGQLNTVKSSVGSTLSQLDRFYDTTVRLNKADITTFTGVVKGVVKALNPLAKLQNTSSGFGLITRQINAFLKTLTGIGAVSQDSITNLKQFATSIVDALQPFAHMKEISIGNIGGQLDRLVKSIISVSTLSPATITKTKKTLQRIFEMFNGLDTSGLGNFSGLGNLIRNLVKLPTIIEQFNQIPTNELDVFIENVKRLASELAPLERSLAPLVTLLNKISSTSLKTGKNMKKASHDVGAFSTAMTTLKHFLTGGSIIYLLRRLGKMVGKAFKESTDYVESLNLFAVALGSRHEDATKAINEWNAVLGLDPRQAMEQWGEFNLLLKGFGDSSQEWLDASFNMSKNLTQLTYDMASLYNVSFEVANTKLQSGISGMTRPLREWGIDISETALKQYAFAKGIDKSVESMSQAEKVQLRYSLIMEKTVALQGDLGKTLQSPGNQLRILKQRLTEASRAFGDLVAPIMQTVLPTFVAFITLTTKMLNVLAETMRGIFGIALFSVEDFITEMGDEASSVADDIDELTSSMYGLVSGIDKFNVLSQGDNKNKHLGEMFEELISADYSSKFLDAIQGDIQEATAKMSGFFDMLTGLLNGVIKFVNSLNIDFGALIKTIATLISIKLVAWLGGVALGLKGLSLGAIATSKALVTLSKVGFFVLLYQIFDLITKWKELSFQQKTIRMSLIAVTSLFLALATALKVFGSTAVVGAVKMAFAKIALALENLSISLTRASISVAGLIASVYLIIQVINNWGNMSGWQRIISVLGTLAVVALTTAVAVGAFQSAWSLGLATAGIVAGIVAVTSAIRSSQKEVKSLTNDINFRASGGFNPAGNLMVTNERGAPEWVGRAGKQSAVVNDTQMTDLMYEAVRDGVVDGLLANDGGANITIDFKGTDTNAFARAIVNPLVNEMRRQGYKVQKT